MSFFWLEAGTRSPRPLTQTPSVTTSERRNNPYLKQESEPPKRKPAMTADQIMTTQVQTLKPESSFEDAKNLFQKSRYRHVPIVNAKGELVGVVSDRDVLRENAALASISGWVQDVAGNTKTIDDFMTRRVLTAEPKTEIRFIAKVMFEERIGSMPIVDGNGRIAGIITRSDILRTVVNTAPLELWI